MDGAVALAIANRKYVPNSGLTQVRARGTRLDVWSHSYGFGIGSTDVYKRFGSIVAECLGLREQNECVSGTAFSDDVSGASWVKVLQNVTRSGLEAVSGSIAGSGNRGFAAPGCCVLAMYGVNDLNILGNTSGVLGPVQTAFETALSRWRATAVFEDTDASVGYTGSWATSTSTATNSGAGFHFTSTNGATWRITTPADFPGGTIAIGVEAPAGANAGGTHTVVANGHTYTLNAFGHSGSSQPFVLRIPGMPAGVNTITGTVSAISNYTTFDYWQHEATGQDAPLVMLVEQPYPTNFSLYGNTPPGPPTNAGVDALNAIMATVQAEFDNRVILVSTASMNSNAAMFAADDLHPSDLGHYTIAQLVLAAIHNAGFVITPSGNIPEPRVYWGTTYPTDTRTYHMVGDRMVNTAPSVQGATDAQYVTWEWRCIIEGRPGTWVPLDTPVGQALGRIIATVTTSIALAAAADTDYVYFFNGAGLTETMPTAVGNTNRYTLKNVGSSNVSIASTSSQTFDGSASPITLPPGVSLDLESDNANWRIV